MMTNQWNGMKSDLAVFHRGPRQASTQRTWCMQEATKRPTKLGVCRDKLAPPPPPPLASADADPAADAVVVDMKWCGCWVGSVWSRLCWLCVCGGGTSSCEKCKQKKIKQTEDKPACCHHDLDNCKIHGKAFEAEHLPLSLLHLGHSMMSFHTGAACVLFLAPSFSTTASDRYQQTEREKLLCFRDSCTCILKPFVISPTILGIIPRKV